MTQISQKMSHKLFCVALVSHNIGTDLKAGT